jgi:hypothetical protein
MTKEKQDKIVVGVTIVMLLSSVLFLFMFNSKNTTASKNEVINKQITEKVNKAQGYAITSIMTSLCKKDSVDKHQDFINRQHDSAIKKLMKHYKKYEND